MQHAPGMGSQASWGRASWEGSSGGKGGSSEAEYGRIGDSRMSAVTATIREKSERRFFFIFLSNASERAIDGVGPLGRTRPVNMASGRSDVLPTTLAGPKRWIIRTDAYVIPKNITF
jgi:hypothetical protein